MTHRESCEAIEPLLAPYGEPACADLLSAADRARVEAHLDACEPCRRCAGKCRAAREALHAHAGELLAPAPALLAARCRALAAREAAPPRRVTRWIGWSAVAAAAAVILFVFLMPTQAIATQLAVDHLKCAKFAASDAHTGTPVQLEDAWRARSRRQIRIPGSNHAEGLRLIGLRRCVSTEGNMAHVMYERAGAPVSLFVLGEGAAGGDGEVEALGQKAILWTSGAARYVLVGRAGDVASAASWMQNEVERRKTQD